MIMKFTFFVIKKFSSHAQLISVKINLTAYFMAFYFLYNIEFYVFYYTHCTLLYLCYTYSFIMLIFYII